MTTHSRKGGGMAKHKTSNYAQEVFLQISLPDQLIPGTIEFAIHSLVDARMDGCNWV